MRTTPTHTPGPWHIGLRTAHSMLDVYGPQGELIALADAVYTDLAVFTDLATAQANARLIAAAPELLALVRAWRISEPLSGYTDAIDAVLAKAEGGQP